MKTSKIISRKQLICILVLSILSCSAKQAPKISPQQQPTANIATSPVNAKNTESNYAQHGQASVYADKFHGKKTASGEIFDQNKNTAASKTLPLGSTAKVVNKKTGKSTTVKITDRGPFVKGRSIDLSKSAAQSIGMDKNGVADVSIEPIKTPGDK